MQASLVQSLKQRLSEWTDVDVAGYWVATALGIAPDPGDEWDFWGDRKDIFWSANVLGEHLCHILDMLAEAGVLEKDENQRFKWNPNWDWQKYNMNAQKEISTS